MKNKYLNIIVLAMLAVVLVLPSAACVSGSLDTSNPLVQAYNAAREWFIMQGANDRIEKVRRGDASILVLDDNNVPVRGARIYHEQQKHDFLFGSNMALLAKNGPNAVNQQWADAYVALFNYGTLPFYWDTYEVKQGQTSETMLLMMADWAKKRGITTKGAPLIWANSLTAWAPAAVDDMQKAQAGRVRDTVSAFCGKIDYWDVVNEPTMGARANNSLGNWMNARTPSTVCTDALGWARSACPADTLIINDFRTDQDFRELLQNVVRQKGKFDAIGIQSLMHRGNWPLYQVWDTCERFKDFEVPLHFSEVTVLSGNPKVGIASEQQGEWPSTPAGEAAQAEYVEKFYTMLFSHPSVQAITWWDLSDYGASQGAPAGLLRNDMTKKPAYNKLLALVRDNWWTRGNVYTGDDGTARLRGFYGTYKLTVEKEGKRVEAELHLARGLDNRLKVKLTGYRQLPPTPLYLLIWPYVAAAVALTIIILIWRAIAKIRRRI